MPSQATNSNNTNQGGEENLWSRILSEVQNRSASNLPQAAVIVLGDNNSGKTSLIARLQRNEDPKKGSGLEYHYLEVNQDYRDGSYAYQLGSALPDVGPGESTRLGVWILDGDPVYAPLLDFALTPTVFDRSILLLCASMAEPWGIMDSLQRWAALLKSHIDESPSFDRNLVREGRNRQIRFWQEYVEPLDSSSHSESGAKVPSMETEQILLPLGETTLTENLGLPIVVLLTKCDCMASLEKEYDLKDEHFDFIQQHVRKFCLNYGAALVYTNVKELRSCDLLYKYILHRVYGFPFTHPALVVDKDSIFIPAGWDNDKKIGILYENMTSLRPDDPFFDHIKKPVLRRPLPKDAEVEAEDEQAFLARQQTIFASQTSPPPAKTQSQESPSLPRAKPPSAASVTGAPAPKKTETGKLPTQVSGQSSEGVLAQFFNNLLKTKTGPNGSTESPGSPQLNASKSFSLEHKSTDAAAVELTRMLAESKESSSVSDSELRGANAL